MDQLKKNSIGEKEIEHRIVWAPCTFTYHRNMLQNQNIRFKTRITFLNSPVRSRHSYACPT